MSTGPTSRRCGACAHRKRRCRTNCLLAPYFQYPESIKDYDSIHRVFGYRNFRRIIQSISEVDRQQAINSFVYEAACRSQEPILGCVSYIISLERQIEELQEKVSQLKTQSNEGSLKQSKDHDLRLSLTYVVDDRDLDTELLQTSSSLLDLTSIPAYSSLATPDYAPPISSSWDDPIQQLQPSDAPQPPPNLVALSDSTSDSPISSGSSSPTQSLPITPNDTTSLQSHWSDLVHHLQTNESQSPLGQTGKSGVPRSFISFPKIPQTSSSRAPTRVTDPSQLITAHQSLAPLPLCSGYLTNLMQKQMDSRKHHSSNRKRKQRKFSRWDDTSWD